MKRILVAYDGGEPAKRALETAALLTRTFDAVLSVVSVIASHPSRSWIDPLDDATTHGQELEEARSLLALQGIEADLLEPIGDPARTIERIASNGGFDTVVVGSRGLNAVSRLFQGSVSEHVATHATATVVIVH